MRAPEPKIGVVLGAGAARGWSHIGALRAFEALGAPIHVVCGCSSGAMVAASYASGRLSALQDLATGMTQSRMLRFFDLSFSGGGVIEGRWIVDFLRQNIGDVAIEDVSPRFGAVATEYGVGREVWFTRGSMIDAVRASIALPGVLTPVHLDGRWLSDGALVNPLPVTLCRSLGADIIIALNTGGDLATVRPPVLRPETGGPATYSSWLAWMTGRADADSAPKPPPRPSYFEVLGDSLLTMQNFIARIRLAADPPDVVITPDLAGVGIMDFHKGAEAIAAGEAAVYAAADRLEAVCALAARTGAAGARTAPPGAESARAAPEEGAAAAEPTADPDASAAALGAETGAATGSAADAEPAADQVPPDPARSNAAT